MSRRAEMFGRVAAAVFAAAASLALGACVSTNAPRAVHPRPPAPDPFALTPTPTAARASSAAQMQIPREPYYYRGLSRYDDGWEEWGQFMLFERNFRDGDLSGGKGQFGLGLELAGRPYDAWLAAEFGLWGSSSEATWTRWGPVFRDFDEETFEVGETGSRSFEISLGARKEVRPFDGPVVVYGGLGGAIVQVEEVRAVGTFEEDSDADVGLYVHWGAYIDFAGNGGLGFDVRLVEGTELLLFDREVSADYAQWSVLLSFWF
ncbi:hypothetical protein [Planctomycetes bacterium Pla163]